MQPSRPQEGFALIIALSLVSFLLVIIVTMTATVVVEKKGGDANVGEMQARQHAKVAAVVALGDLQKYVGVDQRVTARGDILYDPDSSPIQGQAHWTGVWSSKLDPSGNPLNDSVDSDLGLDNHTPHWLVSGETPSFSPDAQVAVAVADSIEIASLGNSVELIDDHVRVPIVDILDENNDEVGAYAFWVSDEGVKARVNLSDQFHPDVSTDPFADFYRLAIPQQADPTVATIDRSGSLERPFLMSAFSGESGWKDTTSRVSRILGEEQLALLSDEMDKERIQREFFHDFSTSSVSLLTNTRDGGFKRDLSTALLSLPSDMANKLMFPSSDGIDDYGSSGTQPGDPGGPAWDQLSDYYKYSLQNMALAGTNTALNFRRPTNLQAGFAPVVVRFHIVEQTFARLAGADSTDALDYEYVSGTFPLITLWNPYDRDMTLPELGLNISASEWRVFHVDPNNVTSSGIQDICNGIIITKNFSSDGAVKTTEGGGSNEQLRFLTLESVTIPAGEAVNFTPPNNSYWGSGADDNMLKAGSSGTEIRGFFSTWKGTDSSLAGGTYLMFDSVSGLSNVRSSNSTNAISGSSYPRNNFYVALMTEPEKGSTASFDKRFQFHNFGGVVQPYNYLPRVVAVGTPSSPISSLTIDSPGSSRNAASASPSPVYVDDLQDHTYDPSAANYSGYFFGQTWIMNFGGANPAPRDVTWQNPNLLSQFNIRSSFVLPSMQHRVNYNSAFEYDYLTFHYGEESPISSNRHLNYMEGTDDISRNGNAYVGWGHASTVGNEKMILFESPVNPVLSIGQLSNANLENIESLSHHVRGSHERNQQGGVLSPSYPIGNSYANIHLPLYETRMNVQDANFFGDIGQTKSFKPLSGTAPHRGGIYDFSYELNQALWDTFYFSTMLPANATDSTIDPNAINFPLPNSRMRLADGAVNWSDLAIENRSAAQLLLDGGFNINSTSVVAWEAMLGALRDVDTLGLDSDDPNNQRHHFSRISNPLVGGVAEIPEISPNNLSNDALFAGFRSLTDDQISDLARSVVREIRLRRSTYGHPHLSLNEFINRSIDLNDINDPSRKRFAYVGGLQSAIDFSGVNGDSIIDEEGDYSLGSGDGLWDSQYAVTFTPAGDSAYHFDSVESIKNRPVAESIPGFLTQADILSKLGAIITPRSDTFTIRTYGSALSTDGANPTTEAYLEVVVQRTANYLDPSDQDYESASATLNQEFGRKFRIVSSRWLDADEI
ncbi:MAG: hypothetical protein ACPGN3_01955 [Opitutales bacterium]